MPLVITLWTTQKSMDYTSNKNYPEVVPVISK